MPWDDREEQILGLLRDYHERFSFAYAAALIHAEEIPEQVNNEIRNALTHLSRAAAVDDRQLGQPEIDKSSSHLERAVRDCYKLAVINVNRRIQKAIWVLDEARGGVVASTARNYNELLKERRRVISEEQKTATGSEQFQKIARAYEDLFTGLVFVYDKILEDYHLTEDKILGFPRWWRVRKAVLWLSGVLVGFMLSVVANHYTDSVVRSFGWGWEWIANVFGNLF